MQAIQNFFEHNLVFSIYDSEDPIRLVVKLITLIILPTKRE